MKNMLRLLLAFLVVFTTITSIEAQQTKHPGIEFYNAENYNAAIVSLRTAVQSKEFESNGELWNYLGLAYSENGSYKEAVKAIEKATKVAPAVSAYHSNLAYLYMLTQKASKARGEANKAIKLDLANLNAYYVRGTANIRDGKLDAAEADAAKTVQLDPAFAPGYLLSSNVYVARLGKKVEGGSDPKSEISLLQKAMDILKAGVEKCKNKPNHKIVDDEYDSIGAFYRYFSGEKLVTLVDNPVPDPNSTPIVIISKPRPSYTDKARSNNVQGTIKIAVLFGASGRVEHLMLLKRLGGGLDEQAAAAARRIVFTPATRDGKTISVVRLLEYTFSIY